MQALSILPLKSGLLVGSRLEFELDCSCFVVSPKTTRKRLCFLEQACFGSSSSISSFIFVSSNRKVLFLCEPKRSLLGSSFGVGWATEQRELELGEEEVSTEDLSSANGGEKNNLRVDVRELAFSLRAAKTADDVDAVLKDKGELPLQVFCAMIKGFGKDKRLKPAVAVVDWLKRKKSESGGVIGPNLFIYNSLLGAMRGFGEAEKILKDMEEEGIVPNIVTYNTLMVIYMEEGEFLKALGILDLTKEKGFEPNPITYSTALLVYRRMEDGMGALEFFVELREKYAKREIGNDVGYDWEFEFVKLENFIGRICYQVMRRWLVKDDNWTTRVLKLLNAMDSAGVRPSREEHERLIWACTREEHYIVGKELYKRIRERFSEISLSVCNHLIWLMGKAKKWWAALEIYEDLLDEGPEPNNLSYELVVSHFNILLSAASKRGIWRWGVRLLNKMEDKGLKPQRRHWNAVLVACSKASETTAAIQIFKAMVDNGEKQEIRAVKTTESRLSDSNRSSHTKKMVTATASTPFSLSSSVVFTRRRNFKRFPVCASLSPEVSPLLRAAHHTVDNYVKSGMIIGLGSGEASDFAIRYLGQQLGSGSLHNVVGVPMSARSASEAAKYGIPLEYYRDGVQIDFAFHDADAVEENTLIAVIGRRRSSQEDDYILKQKSIVKVADEAVFMIKEEQYKAGLEGSIPVLVQSLNWLAIAEEIDDLYLGDAEVWRRASVENEGPLGGDFPIVTSDGHNILDVIFTTPIRSLADLATSLDKIDGVVDHGLIIKTRCTVVIAEETVVRSVTLQTSALEGGVRTYGQTLQK